MEEEKLSNDEIAARQLKEAKKEPKKESKQPKPAVK